MKPAPEGTSRRAQIVAAAARLFDERGYHTTSMDDIAAAVGIKKPTLYHHVTSKTQLVLWIHDELVDELTARLERRIDQGMPGDRILLAVMEDIFELLETKPGHLRVYFEHHREIPGEEGAIARRKRDHYTALVEGIITRGADDGLFAAPNVTLTTLAFFGMCNWAYQWYRPGGDLDHTEIARYFWQTFRNGLAVS